VRRALIVCIGNDLVGDDAVGYEVYQLLRRRPLPPSTRLVFLGVGGLALIDEMAGEELLVVVDAVNLGGAPGALHVMAFDDIPQPQTRPVSGHGIGVREALAVCQRLYPEKAAATVYLVGIEGDDFSSVGGGLSEPVEAALPKAVSTILGLLDDVHEMNLKRGIPGKTETEAGRGQ
jgi:hydrogenase maturation protease